MLEGSDYTTSFKMALKQKALLSWLEDTFVSKQQITSNVIEWEEKIKLEEYVVTYSVYEPQEQEALDLPTDEQSGALEPLFAWLNHTAVSAMSYEAKAQYFGVRPDQNSIIVLDARRIQVCSALLLNGRTQVVHKLWREGCLRFSGANINGCLDLTTQVAPFSMALADAGFNSAYEAKRWAEGAESLIKLDIDSFIKTLKAQPLNVQLLYMLSWELHAKLRQSAVKYVFPRYWHSAIHESTAMLSVISIVKAFGFDVSKDAEGKQMLDYLIGLVEETKLKNEWLDSYIRHAGLSLHKKGEGQGKLLNSMVCKANWKMVSYLLSQGINDSCYAGEPILHNALINGCSVDTLRVFAKAGYDMQVCTQLNCSLVDLALLQYKYSLQSIKRGDCTIDEQKRTMENLEFIVRYYPTYKQSQVKGELEKVKGTLERYQDMGGRSK